MKRFRESDLSNQGYYLLAQELAYQWLGSWVTPLWWSDAHLNKALAGFLAASAALEVNFMNFTENLNIQVRFEFKSTTSLIENDDTKNR